jgi:hypothetical protein
MLWRGRDARLHSRRLLGDSPTRQSDLLTIVQEIGSVPKIDHQGSTICAKGLREGAWANRFSPRAKASDYVRIVGFNRAIRLARAVGKACFKGGQHNNDGGFATLAAIRSRLIFAEQFCR